MPRPYCRLWFAVGGGDRKVIVIVNSHSLNATYQSQNLCTFLFNKKNVTLQPIFQAAKCR
jgi:hypothetical protein